jgi:nucleoid-associated protein YgaU
LLLGKDERVSNKKLILDSIQTTNLNLYSRTKNMARKQGNPPTTHTVEAGDILFDIAQVYYGDGNKWPKIAAANGNIKPESLQVGQKLLIPA